MSPKLENPLEKTKQANGEIAKLIRERKWSEINFETPNIDWANGVMLVKHRGMELSLIDLAIRLGAPEKVRDVLIGCGFEHTEIVKLRIKAANPDVPKK